jgi:hypothetical protein
MKASLAHLSRNLSYLRVTESRNTAPATSIIALSRPTLPSDVLFPVKTQVVLNCITRDKAVPMYVVMVYGGIVGITPHYGALYSVRGECATSHRSRIIPGTHW